MKLITNRLIIALMAFLAASCSKSDLHGDKRLPTGEVSIQLALPSANSAKVDDPNQGTPAENYIGVTQFVLFAPTADQSGKVERVITVDTKQSVIIDMQTVWNATTQTLSMRGLDTDTPKSVYVIANATAANGYDPAAIKVGETTEKELLEAVTKSTQLTTPTMGNGMLMSGIAKSHDFKTSPALTVDLTRQLVKIKLTVKINATFLSTFPQIDFASEEAFAGALLTLYNVPSHSFVYGTSPASVPVESGLLDFSPVTITKSGSGNTLKWEAEIYTCENPVSGSTAEAKKSSTWFSLRLPYKNGETLVSENYYKFHISDPADTNNPHKTVRNHIYDLTATVTGFGGTTPDDGRAQVTTKVLDWNVVNLPDKELGEYLRFSKLTTADETFTLTDGDYVVGTGETIKVHCKTNVGEWYALTYRNDESTPIHTSDATDVISSTDVQDVDIVLPATTSDISVEYTIKLYHSEIAPEGGEPLKTMTLKQVDGVIPNSVLVKSFMVGGRYHNGWPVDKLPPHGLQLAKRGNVLPSGTALVGDIGAYWSTVTVDTYVSEIGIGFGKSNTDKLLKLEAGLYPAVNKCKTLDKEGWYYFPSKEELMLIYANKGLLGSSYSFTSIYYWSATQFNETTAWFVEFASSGYASNGNKINGLNGVRCVKNI